MTFVTLEIETWSPATRDTSQVMFASPTSTGRTGKAADYVTLKGKGLERTGVDNQAMQAVLQSSSHGSVYHL